MKKRGETLRVFLPFFLSCKIKIIIMKHQFFFLMRNESRRRRRRSSTRVFFGLGWGFFFFLRSRVQSASTNSSLFLFSIFTPSASNPSSPSSHGFRPPAQVRDQSGPSRGKGREPALVKRVQKGPQSRPSFLLFQARDDGRTKESKERAAASPLSLLDLQFSHHQSLPIHPPLSPHHAGRASPRSPVSPRVLSALRPGVNRERESGRLACEAGGRGDDQRPFFSVLVIQASPLSLSFFSTPTPLLALVLLSLFLSLGSSLSPFGSSPSTPQTVKSACSPIASNQRERASPSSPPPTSPPLPSAPS